MHLTDCCRFLNCSVRMGGGGVERFVMNSEGISGGGGRKGGERCVMNHNGPLGDRRNRCIMNSKWLCKFGGTSKNLKTGRDAYSGLYPSTYVIKRLI